MRNRWEKGPFVWSHLPSHPRTEPAVSWSERQCTFEQRVVLLSLGQKRTRPFDAKRWGTGTYRFSHNQPTNREGNPSHRGVESGSLCDIVIGSRETEEHNGASREVLSISSVSVLRCYHEPKPPPRTTGPASQQDGGRPERTEGHYRRTWGTRKKGRET